MNVEFNKRLLFENIAFLVKERGLKIGELETAAGVSSGYISRASKEGGPTPGVEFIVNVANKLMVSIDTLISAHMAELTPTERYIISLLNKLERDTNNNKLDWKRESAESLNSMEADINGCVDHPLFKFETFSEWNDSNGPIEQSGVRFISHTFDLHTYITGTCFNLRLKNGAILYIMDFSQSIHLVDDLDAYAKEVWIYQVGNGTQYLCSNRDLAPIGQLVDSLYTAISENSRHPKINSGFQYVINAFLKDDISDDEDYLPF